MHWLDRDSRSGEFFMRQAAICERGLLALGRYGQRPCDAVRPGGHAGGPKIPESPRNEVRNPRKKTAAAERSRGTRRICAVTALFKDPALTPGMKGGGHSDIEEEDIWIDAELLASDFDRRPEPFPAHKKTAPAKLPKRTEVVPAPKIKCAAPQPTSCHHRNVFPRA